MLKNKGFFLSDLLLSLSILMIVSLFLLPLLSRIGMNGNNIKLEKQAIQLLFEEMEKYVSEPDSQESKTVLRNGISYTIYWRVKEDGKLEVCADIASPGYKQKQICREPE